MQGSLGICYLGAPCPRGAGLPLLLLHDQLPLGLAEPLGPAAHPAALPTAAEQASVDTLCFPPLAPDADQMGAETGCGPEQEARSPECSPALSAPLVTPLAWSPWHGEVGADLALILCSVPVRSCGALGGLRCRAPASSLSFSFLSLSFLFYGLESYVTSEGAAPLTMMAGTASEANTPGTSYMCNSDGDHHQAP